MSNVEHTFTIPVTAPFLDYRSLQAYLGHRSERKIGTAITVQRNDGVFDFRIHFTLFACISTNEVMFFYPYSPNGSPTEEQQAWVSKIAGDNGVQLPAEGTWRGAYPAVPLLREPRKHISGPCWCNEVHEPRRVPRKLEKM